MTDTTTEPSPALTEAARQAIDAIVDKLHDEYKTGLDKVGPPWEPEPRTKIGEDE